MCLYVCICAQKRKESFYVHMKKNKIKERTVLQYEIVLFPDYFLSNFTYP